MKRFLSPVLFLIVCLILQGCKKDDPFEATQEGKNTLGFYFDGKKYEYDTSGGFPSEYPYENCVYGWYFTTENKLSVSAIIADSKLCHFSFELAERNIQTGKIYELTKENSTFNAVLTFVYPHDKGNGTTEYTYKNPTAKRGFIEFTKFDREHRIASGKFEFDFDIESDSGEISSKRLTGGMFDVYFQESATSNDDSFNKEYDQPGLSPQTMDH